MLAPGQHEEETMIVAKATRQQFEQVKQYLRTHQGMDPGDGDIGQLSKDGVKAEFQYDGDSLRIELTHKPFFLSWETIENGILDGLKQQGLAPVHQG
jgi:hypothetical protein